MSSDNLTAAINSALRLVYKHLHEFRGEWLIGGSCSLILQHIVLPTQPRDLDIYADEANIALIDTKLRQYAMDHPIVNTTPIYRSILSHYHMADVEIELVGNFTINAHDSTYQVEVKDVMSNYCVRKTIEGCSFNLMPLAHELIFNLLRDRADRYELIAEAMRSTLDKHLPALHALLERNNLSDELLRRLSRLLDYQFTKKVTT